jgi:hypothetical protein
MDSSGAAGGALVRSDSRRSRSLRRKRCDRPDRLFHTRRLKNPNTIHIKNFATVDRSRSVCPL